MGNRLVRALLGTMALIAGLALLAGAALTFVEGRERVAAYASAEATPAATAPGKETPAAPGTVRVRFTTHAGQPVVAPLETGLFGAAIDLSGGPIPVLYDPAQPQRAVLDHPLALYDVPLLLLPPGLGLLLVFAIVRSGNRRRTQAQQRWAPPPRGARRPAHELAPAQGAAERLQRVAGAAGATLAGVRGPTESLSVGDRRPTVVPRAETHPVVRRPGNAGLIIVVAAAIAVLLVGLLVYALAEASGSQVAPAGLPTPEEPRSATSL